jgi:glutathione S-transferase
MKGIPYTTKWLYFYELEPELKKLGLSPNKGIPFPYSVPTIYDPNTKRSVTDSFEITKYLDDQYPDTVALLPKGTRAISAAFSSVTNNLLLSVFAAFVLTLWESCHEKDKPYFRATREGLFGGAKLEHVVPTGEKLTAVVQAQ